ncbi:MAG TPA: PLP-dependent aminotransferase family protein [Ilumatobacteraceae bacterium]
MSTIRFQQVNVPPGVIDLGVGQPQNALLPSELMRRAAEHTFGAPGSDYLQYGAEWGDGHLRLALGRYLTDAYGCPVEAEHLFITNGNSQALELLCTVLTEPGDVVIVEEPTYFLALNIFRDHHVDVVSVRVDADGLVVDDLDVELSRLAAAGRRVRFIYTIPTYQNPTGATLTPERREQLVEMSRRHDVLVVADEVYHLLHYGDERPPAPMSAYVDRGPILSIGTFSKILAPGLRLGWVHGSPERLARLAGSGLVESGGGLNPVPCALVAAILEEGWQADFLRELRSTYGRRVETMAGALRVHVPGWVEYDVPDGGYFFWLTLPAPMDAAEVRERAARAGLDFRHGALFSSRGGLPRHLRLSFAYYDDGEIVEGVRRLGRVLGQT